jgi:hypothetical protein
MDDRRRRGGHRADIAGRFAVISGPHGERRLELASVVFSRLVFPGCILERHLLQRRFQLVGKRNGDSTACPAAFVCPLLGFIQLVGDLRRVLSPESRTP